MAEIGEVWGTSRTFAEQTASAETRYGFDVRGTIAPLVSEAIGLHISTSEHPDQTGRVLHDLGGYNGLVLDELDKQTDLTGWRRIITDVTEPSKFLASDVEFHQVPAWDIGEHIAESSVDVTVSTNVLHVLDMLRLAETVRAIKHTSKPGGLTAILVPHPVWVRRKWTDYVGDDLTAKLPERTERRGVFIDNYTPELQTTHAFTPGEVTYPRTVESNLSVFLDEGFALTAIKAVHNTHWPQDTVANQRYIDTMPLLPKWLFTTWTAPSE